MDSNFHYQASSSRRGSTSKINAENLRNEEKYSDKLKMETSHTHKSLNGNSSTSNSGILYYKWLSEQMENEIGELQIALEKSESEMITQKQNIKDMIYAKNKLLCDFHEQFTKFSQKIEYENKMEEEIEHLVKFLDQLMPINNEINYVKSLEITIRNYMIAKYQVICSEMLPVKDTIEKEVEQLQQKLNEFNEWKAEWEHQDKLNLDINQAIDLHREKLIHLKWLNKNEVSDTERLRNEGERIQIQTDTEILKKQQTLKDDAAKIQQAFSSIKTQFSKLNDFQNELVQFKQEIEKSNDILIKVKQSTANIEAQITEKQIKLEELPKKKEVNSIHLREVEYEKKIEIEKQEKLSNSSHENRKRIADQETLLNNLLNEERSIDEKRKQILDEINSQKEKIASFDSRNTFANEITRNENLTKDIDDLTQKNNTTRMSSLELNNELETKMEKINELKKNLLLRNISGEDNSPEKNLLHDYLTVENEQNAMSKFIDDELDTSLNEICKRQPCIQSLKKQFEELLLEGYELEGNLMEKEKLWQESANSAKNYENTIFTLKQNVYQGKYITVQGLNKQLADLTNYAKNERNTVEKLKGEIGAIQETAEIGKKRRLMSPNKIQDIGPARTSRTARPKKKVTDELKNTNEKGISKDKDIYSFA